MTTEEKERDAFNAWWAVVGKYAMPDEEDIPPKQYKFYETAARMAWSECACRKNTIIHSLKLKDHEIAKAVNQIVQTAREFSDSQQLRERIAEDVRCFLLKS